GDTSIEVIGESSTGGSTCNVIAQQRPDVILVDFESDINSAEAINDLRQKSPLSWIIVLSGWEQMDGARQALAAGADAIVMRFQHPEVLLATVERMGKSPALLLKTTSPQAPITTKVDKRKGVAQSVPCNDALTDRERAVIGLVGKGLSNREIANNLCIAETTVRHHLTSIFDKLGVSTRQKLLIRAQQCGLVEMEGSA
ncbi:MAG TPA: response regulator transcription factor, partial [Nitrospira sp.]